MNKLVVTLALAACGGNPGYKAPAINPAFKGSPLPAPIVWLAPIPCSETKVDPGAATKLHLVGVSHPGEVMPDADLAGDACAYLSNDNKSAPLDKSWQAPAHFASGIGAVLAERNAPSLAVLIGATNCTPTIEERCDSFAANWAVFVFDAKGVVRMFHRLDPFVSGAVAPDAKWELPADIQRFADEGVL